MHKLDRLQGAHVPSLCPSCLEQSLGQVCRPFERRRFHTDRSRGGREAREGCGGPTTPALRLSEKRAGGGLVLRAVSQTGLVHRVATARELIACRLPSLAPKVLSVWEAADRFPTSLAETFLTPPKWHGAPNPRSETWGLPGPCAVQH